MTMIDRIIELLKKIPNQACASFTSLLTPNDKTIIETEEPEDDIEITIELGKGFFNPKQNPVSQEEINKGVDIEISFEEETPKQKEALFIFGDPLTSEEDSLILEVEPDILTLNDLSILNNDEEPVDVISKLMDIKDYDDEPIDITLKLIEDFGDKKTPNTVGKDIMEGILFARNEPKEDTALINFLDRNRPTTDNKGSKDKTPLNHN